MQTNQATHTPGPLHVENGSSCLEIHAAVGAHQIATSTHVANVLLNGFEQRSDALASAKRYADLFAAAPEPIRYDWKLMVCEYDDPGCDVIREYWALSLPRFTVDDVGEAECWVITYMLEHNGEWRIDHCNSSQCDYDDERAEQVGRIDGLMPSEVQAAMRKLVEKL